MIPSATKLSTFTYPTNYFFTKDRICSASPILLVNFVFTLSTSIDEKPVKNIVEQQLQEAIQTQSDSIEHK
jgi:hypothetical protein